MYDYESKLVDSSRVLADMLVQDIGNNPEKFREIINISFRDEYPVSMRAARIIPLITEIYPELLNPYIPWIITKLQHLKTEGVRRGFLKALSESSYSFNDEQMGILANLAFTWLPDPKEPISVRYYSIEIILKISEKYPELQIELKPLLHELLQDAPSGIKAKSQIALNYLKRVE